jgi:hypothetical protein
LSLKKFVWSGSAVAIAALLAVTLLLAGPAQTAKAVAPTTLNVIIDEDGAGGEDNDSVASSSSAQTIHIVVDIDDDEAFATAGGQLSDETVVTVTTSVGTWPNGSNSIAIQCANDDGIAALVTVDDDDTGANSATPVAISETGAFEGEADTDDPDAAQGVDNGAVAADLEEGCYGIDTFLTLPGNVATGSVSISASTSTGSASGSDTLTVVAGTGSTPAAIAHVSQSHDSIGFTGTDYNPKVNGTVWVVRVTDASGLGVNGRSVNFTTNRGVLVNTASETATPSESDVEDLCDSTTGFGTTASANTNTLGTSSTNTGRAQIILCGTSAGVGTATLTASVSGFTATDDVTIANRPANTDIVAVQTGDQVEVTVTVGGVPAADDTEVRFAAIPTTNAVVSATCVVLHDGKASTTAAVTAGTSASLLITLTEVIDDGDDTECETGSARTYASRTIALGAGTGTGTQTPGCPAGAAWQASSTVPARGSIGLMVVRCNQTAQTLVVAFAAAGCPVESLAILVAGRWLIFINGAPAVVNAAFPVTLIDLTPFFVRCA